MNSLYERIAVLEREGTKAAVITVVKVSGSTPRAPGARMIVFEDGKSEFSIGGGKVEFEAIQAAQLAIKEERSSYIDFALSQELGMCCGGKMSLFIEPLCVAPRLLVFGAGHVATALCRMAAHTGFIVHVADEREDLLRLDRLAEARRLHDDFHDPKLPFGPDCFIMITTHDHALDQKLLERCLTKEFQWIGVIGSRRKAKLTRDRLAHKGFPQEVIARVRIPVGLAIQAETPEEIAISILSELIAVRRGAKLTTALETKGAVIDD
jgi:xanthine dehydrogenase accessory factor